jgi:putative transcriptional regulator
MLRQPEYFPETIKVVRHQLALSLEELTHSLVVSYTIVNRWENGKTMRSKMAQRQFAQLCE